MKTYLVTVVHREWTTKVYRVQAEDEQEACDAMDDDYPDAGSLVSSDDDGRDMEIERLVEEA